MTQAGILGIAGINQGLLMRALFEKISVGPARSFYVEEQRMAEFDAPWHFHPEIELTYIIEGRGRRFVGDSVESFVAGDLVLIGPNLPHFWHSEGRESPAAKAHSVVVQFRADFLGSEVFGKPELGGLRGLLAKASRGLQFTGVKADLAAAPMRGLTQLDALPALLELLRILHILSQMKRARPLASAAYEPSLDRHAEQRLARVYAFLMRTFREQRSLAEIAAVACMTAEAFSRYFKRVTGRNVTVFINELRIEHAGRLLRETDCPIGDIAADAGFTTLSSFNRRFLERMNCTPREYRQAYQEKTSPPSKFQAPEITGTGLGIRTKLKCQS